MESLNKILKIKFSLSGFIMGFGVVFKKIIQQLKKNLAIVLCIQKFQSDVFNKKFLLRVDCKSAKEIFIYFLF